ncbi:MAG: hypothetical protein J6C98_01650 [Oscillospiraceae bacterium]|nr:hypothetical protein [Oscillospiraceae bacterium]
MKKFQLTQFVQLNLEKIVISIHLILTVLGSILFFSGSGGDIHALLGNHSAVYPIIGVLIATVRESLVLLGICLVYWPLSLTVLAIGYYTALKSAHYKTLMISTFVDILFSLWMLILSVSGGEFNSFHVMMLIGIVLNVPLGIYVLHLWRTADPDEDKKLKTA